MKKYFWSLLAFTMVTMLGVSFSSCSGDDIEDNATIVGVWVHQDGVGEADVLTFVGTDTQGDVTYIEYDNDDYPVTMNSTYTFNRKTGILKVPGFTIRDVEVKALTGTKLKLKYFPDDDDTTTFTRQ